MAIIVIVTCNTIIIIKFKVIYSIDVIIYNFNNFISTLSKTIKVFLNL